MRGTKKTSRLKADARNRPDPEKGSGPDESPSPNGASENAPGDAPGDRPPDDAPDDAQDAKFGSAPPPPMMKPKPKVGVVLGSDGVKAFSALPIIDFLNENKIRVDMVAATGGGALLAALWGLNYDLRHIVSLLAEALDKRHYSRLNIVSMLGMMNLPIFGTGSSGGLLKTSGLKTVFRKIFKDARIEDLRPKTVITTTNILNGEVVPLESGNLADAVYAAGSIYPLMPPIDINGTPLGDGAMSEPLPIMECFRHGMDVIVASYFDDDAVSQPDGFMQQMFNAGRLMTRNMVKNRLPLAIAMHSYEIVPVFVRHHRAVNIWDVGKMKEVIHCGNVALRTQSNEILRVIRDFPPQGGETPGDKLRKMKKNLDDTMIIKKY